MRGRATSSVREKRIPRVRVQGAQCQRFWHNAHTLICESGPYKVKIRLAVIHQKNVHFKTTEIHCLKMTAPLWVDLKVFGFL